MHWHLKLQMWLPAGGHVEPNEDPVQTAVREALEETGIKTCILTTVSHKFDFLSPRQVQPPVTILVEDINDPVDGFHQHIDSIYFLTPTDNSEIESPPGWRWITREQLVGDVTIISPHGAEVKIAQDVRELGILAIETYRRTYLIKNSNKVGPPGEN